MPADWIAEDDREFEMASPARLARAHADVVTHPPTTARRSEVRERSGGHYWPGRRARRRPLCASSGRCGQCGSCAGGAEVAPVAQGRDGDADNVGDFLHGQQFIVSVRSDGHSGPLDVAYGVPPGGLPVAICEVRRMSLLLHKDRGQVLVINREEKEASPPSYPFGRTSGLRM
jgi:hypothetical protein